MESREIDTAAAADCLARQASMHRLPRRAQRRWPRALDVIVDRRTHLVPIWADQELVIACLARFLQNARLRIAGIGDGDDVPLGIGAVDDDWEPTPGGLVLALTDLGTLASDRFRSEAIWLRLAHDIAAVGGRAVALVPVHETNIAARLRQAWAVVAWERPAPPPIADDQKRAAQLRRLKRLLSPAVRIEPGLLRSVRVALVPDAEASLETAFWQCSSLMSSSSVAATWEPDARRRLQTEFAREITLDDRKTLFAILRSWRPADLHEAWFEEVLAAAEHSSDALPGQDLEDARSHFEALRDRQRSGKGQALGAGTCAWIRRADERANGTIGYRAFNELADAVRARKRRETPGAGPPPPSVERLHLWQQDGDLCLATEWLETLIGSPLAELPAGVGLCDIAPASADDSDGPADRSAYWEGGRPPSWAENWGVDEYGPWVTFVVEATDGRRIEQKMRWIPPGRFMMGSPRGEVGRWDSEGPYHEVTFATGYWLFDTACRQDLYEAITGANPSSFQGSDRPVETVSWHDARAFLDQVNAAVPGLDLDLPSEAQWEYACRAGTTTAYSFGDDITREQGNFESDETVPVGSLPANAWGLFEMQGNVLEWCGDHWHDDYRGGPNDGSAWIDSAAESSADRVVRGGSWNLRARNCRAAYRVRSEPEVRGNLLGFRPARGQGLRSDRSDAVPVAALWRERSPDKAQTQGSAPATPGAISDDKSAQGVFDRRPEATRIRVAPGAAPQRVRWSGTGFVVETDRAEMTFARLIKPDWASAVGRDRYGLFADIEVDAVRQRLRFIPPGRFDMGSRETEAGRYDWEGPVHPVTLREGFWLFDTPCTQALWQAVMGDNPSKFKSRDRPVEQVSWNDVQGFLQRINARMPGLDLVMPSEAQWEYACRAGTETAIYAGNLKILGDYNAPALDAIAWYGGNSGVGFELEKGWDSSGWKEKQYEHTSAGTRPVAAKDANPWGLYDTLGNVWEWCADHWHDDDYQNAPNDGSAWIDSDAATGADRVFRGGSWRSRARSCRAASRRRSEPGFRGDFLGFRPARGQA